MTRLRALFLPNRRQAERLAAHRPGTAPDPARGAQELSRAGVETIVRDLNRAPWNPLAGKGTFYAGFDPLRALRVLLLDRDVDLICCGFESGLFVIALLRRLFRFRPKLVMFELNAPGWRMRDRVVNFLLPRLDAVFVLTAQQRDALRLRCATPVHLVGFGIDDSFFTPRQVPCDGSILAVGDDYARDYPTLLAAAAGFEGEVRLRTATPLDVPAAVSHRVHRLPRLTELELRDAYAAASIVVVPLRPVKSPSGITTILEAMAMGRPVIATAVPTTQGLIDHGTTGLLVPPHDPAALGDAVRRLHADPDLRARLGQAARHAIETRLSLRAHLTAMAGAMRVVAGAGGEAGAMQAMPEAAG